MTSFMSWDQTCPPVHPQNPFKGFQQWELILTAKLSSQTFPVITQYIGSAKFMLIDLFCKLNTEKMLREPIQLTDSLFELQSACVRSVWFLLHTPSAMCLYGSKGIHLTASFETQLNSSPHSTFDSVGQNLALNHKGPYEAEGFAYFVTNWTLQAI